MSKALELIEALSENRKKAEAELENNLNDKDWVEKALNKMGKKWLFSGDVNAYDHGGTWWKWDGRNVEVVSIPGVSGTDMHITTNSYSVKDLMKDGPGVIGYVDATWNGKETKPENQIANIIYGMISYYGGDTDTYDLVDPDDEDQFWKYMKRAHGVTQQ